MTAALAVLVPLLAGCVAAALSPFAKRGITTLTLVAAAAVATLGLTVAVLTRAGEHPLVWFGGWTPRSGAAVGVGFAVDGIGAGLAVFVAALGLAALIVSLRVIESENLVFDALAFVFVGAMLGFCLTGDLFNLFVFFELMSVSAYVLVGYEVRRRAALEGALAFAVTNTVGSILLLFGISLVYGHTGALNLAQIGRILGAAPADSLVLVAFALIACGLLVKAAVVPFHLWTADAYAIAPTPVCILLAGAFSELGLFGLARVYWTAFEGALGAPELRAILLALGVITAVLAAAMCAAQHHLKRMLAFATVAQVGLFLIGLALLTPAGVAGTAVWVVADGLVKAALFGGVAELQHRFGSVEVADLHGRGRELRPVGVVFAACAAMIASVPLTGSFEGRSLVEDAALELPGYGWLPLVMALVSGLVAGALLRAAARVFLGWGEPAPRDPAGEEAPDDEPDRESGDSSGTSPVLWVPTVLFALAAVAWGHVPDLREAVARAAASFTDAHAYAARVLDGAAARPAHVPLLHAPGATAWAYAALSLAVAVAAAAIPLRKPDPLSGAPERAFDAVRALHNGRLGDYAAWTVAGCAVLVAAFGTLLG